MPGLATSAIPAFIDTDRTLRVKVIDACGLTCTSCHNEPAPALGPGSIWRWLEVKEALVVVPARDRCGTGTTPGTGTRRAASSAGDLLDAVDGPVKVFFRDHQRRREPDRGAVGVLGEHAERGQPLAGLPAGGE